MSTVLSIWLALILGVVAGLKARHADRTGAALHTYGVTGRRAQRAVVWTLVCLELGLAGAIALGAAWAPAVVAGLFLLFALGTSAALLAGREGRPCACFGSASRLSWSSPARALSLAIAGAALALGWVPAEPSGYDRWLTVATSVMLVAIAALAVALLALAREVGVLRLGAGGRGALEIAEEGPELGSPQAWAAAIQTQPRALLRLAIFTSEGCPLCRQMQPAVEHVAADPVLAVRIFDELADMSVWSQARVPGSPYAVVLSREGTALAKGTFNSLPQLESVLATARFREQGLPLAA